MPATTTASRSRPARTSGSSATPSRAPPTAASSSPRTRIVSDVQIVKNWADGGGCTINLAEKGRGPFAGIVITDNVFGRDTKHYNCAIISPTTTKITAARNVFTDGTVAAVQKG